MDTLKNKFGYWSYGGIYIPDEIDSVPHRDQANRIYKDGRITQVYSNQIPMTIQTYQTKYGKLYGDHYIYINDLNPNQSIKRILSGLINYL